MKSHKELKILLIIVTIKVCLFGGLLGIGIFIDKTVNNYRNEEYRFD